MLKKSIYIGINANSGGMWPGKIAEITRKFSDKAVIEVSTDLESAARMYRTIIKDGYQICAILGGDGTQQSARDNLRDVARELNKPVPIQAITADGGTGKALASYVGAMNGVSSLDKIVNYPHLDKIPTLDLSMLDVYIGDSAESKSAFCVGLGLDAEVVGQYDQETVKGIPGYLIAIAKVLSGRRKFSKVKITSIGGKVTSIENNVWRKQEAEPGTVIYEGPSANIIAGVIPNFGFNVQAFPFANAAAETGRMHLRILAVETRNQFIKKVIPKAWQMYSGTIRAPFLEYLGRGFEIEVKNSEHLELGGDYQGLHPKVRFEVSKDPMKVVDIWKI